jgi:hypothetical protein
VVALPETLPVVALPETLPVVALPDQRHTPIPCMQASMRP